MCTWSCHERASAIDNWWTQTFSSDHHSWKDGCASRNGSLHLSQSERNCSLCLSLSLSLIFRRSPDNWFRLETYFMQCQICNPEPKLKLWGKKEKEGGKDERGEEKEKLKEVGEGRRKKKYSQGKKNGRRNSLFCIVSEVSAGQRPMHCEREGTTDFAQEFYEILTLWSPSSPSWPVPHPVQQRWALMRQRHWKPWGLWRAVLEIIQLLKVFILFL